MAPGITAITPGDPLFGVQILFQIIVNSYGCRDPRGPWKSAFLPASVAVVRISPSQRGSRSNSGQKRRSRRELEQHGTRGNNADGRKHPEGDPDILLDIWLHPLRPPPGRRRGNCNQIQCSEDSLFSFHCRTDAKRRSLITYYGRWTVQFITDCKIKDAGPKHAATFCILHQKSCNVSLWFHGTVILKIPSSCHLFLIAIKYR